MHGAQRGLRPGLRAPRPVPSPPAAPALLSSFLCLDSSLLLVSCPAGRSPAACALRPGTRHGGPEARHAVPGSATLGPAPFRLRNPVNAKHVGENENEGARRHLRGQRARGRQAAGGRLHTPNGTTKAESRDEEEQTKGATTAVKSHIPKTPSARFSQGRRRREHRHAAWRAGEPGHSLLSDSEIEGVEKGNLWPHSLCTISSTVSRGGEKEL